MRKLAHGLSTGMQTSPPGQCNVYNKANASTKASTNIVVIGGVEWVSHRVDIHSIQIQCPEHFNSPLSSNSIESPTGYVICYTSMQNKFSPLLIKGPSTGIAGVALSPTSSQACTGTSELKSACSWQAAMHLRFSSLQIKSFALLCLPIHLTKMQTSPGTCFRQIIINTNVSKKPYGVSKRQASHCTRMHIILIPLCTVSHYSQHPFFKQYSGIHSAVSFQNVMPSSDTVFHSTHIIL